MGIPTNIHYFNHYRPVDKTRRAEHMFEPFDPGKLGKAENISKQTSGSGSQAENSLNYRLSIFIISLNYSLTNKYWLCMNYICLMQCIHVYNDTSIQEYMYTMFFRSGCGAWLKYHIHYILSLYIIYIIIINRLKYITVTLIYFIYNTGYASL